MTGPAVPSNSELIERAHAVDLEGDESVEVAGEVETFVAGLKSDLQSARDALAAAEGRALSDEERQAINDALSSGIAKTDTVQTALRALVTPSTEPIPDTPVGRKRGGKR